MANWLPSKSCHSFGLSSAQLHHGNDQGGAEATDVIWYPWSSILAMKVPTPYMWYGPTLLSALFSYTLFPAVRGLQPKPSHVCWPPCVPSVLTPGLSRMRIPFCLHPPVNSLSENSTFLQGRGCASCFCIAPHPAHSLVYNTGSTNTFLNKTK